MCPLQVQFCARITDAEGGTRLIVAIRITIDNEQCALAVISSLFIG